MINRCSGSVSSSMIVVELSTGTFSTPLIVSCFGRAPVSIKIWRSDLSRLAVRERDLKRFRSAKMGLAPQEIQIEPLHRRNTALEVIASALDHTLFAFAHGLQIDGDGAGVYTLPDRRRARWRPSFWWEYSRR